MLLYYITDRSQFSGGESGRRECLLKKIEEAAGWGVDYIQLRERDLSSRELEQLAGEAMRRVSDTKCKLLINSRTDIALAVSADGVHLRSTDIFPHEVRSIWQEAKPGGVPVIAVSCHEEREVIAAKQAAADFVVFGPVFEKSGLATTGLNLLRSACGHNIPVLALGGVTAFNARACVQAGAAGIAAIRLFQESDIKNVVESLRE